MFELPSYLYAIVPFLFDNDANENFSVLATATVTIANSIVIVSMTSNEEAVLLLSVNGTFKSRPHCRIEESAGQSIIAALLDLCGKKGKTRVWNMFSTSYFICSTRYLFSGQLATVVYISLTYEFENIACARSGLV